MYIRSLACIWLLFLAACATGKQRIPQGQNEQAQVALRMAQKKSARIEDRIGRYLEAADIASRDLGADASLSRGIYNTAVAELADLLQEHPEEWDRSAAEMFGKYELRVNDGEGRGVWKPGYFTDLVPTKDVSFKHVRRKLINPGVGGTLVGVHKTSGLLRERKPFEAKQGFLAPVSATLDFSGSEAELTLWDPAVHATVNVRDETHALAANLTAPIAYQPFGREFWDGLMAMVQVERFTEDAGLFMLQPYNPDRIPVILVHGLASTSQMWFDVINEVESVPELRGRFQFWVFRYPTGNPITFSAARLRRQLDELETLYPGSGDLVLIGHSMGGLVSKMQAMDSGRSLWDATMGKRADALYARFDSQSAIKQALVFEANPDVGRLVFISVPHRGSELAIGAPGRIAMRLIRLPTDIVQLVTSSLAEVFRGDDGRLLMPNGITSLSPKSKILRALDRLPIQAPHHSIIGDRGRGDTPESSDGVVPYSSSHLDSAQSELIVPGDHGAYDRQDTIQELIRILRLHIGRSAG